MLPLRTDGEQGAYKWLLGVSPFVAGGLVFLAFPSSGGKWRYLGGTLLGIFAFAFFAISASVLAYSECA